MVIRIDDIMFSYVDNVENQNSLAHIGHNWSQLCVVDIGIAQNLGHNF